MKFNKRLNKETGDAGEEDAASFLLGKGYKILERNLRTGFGEIDILVQEKDTIVIVEVKTVRGSGFGLAQELVRYKKQKKLKLLGRYIEQQFPKSPIRIDVIGVDLSGDDPGIEHLKNVIN